MPHNPIATKQFVPYLRPNDEFFTAMDAKAVAMHGPWVITSPNMDMVPALYHFEDEDLQARKDGHFGFVDCFQWPQWASSELVWAPLILRQEEQHLIPDDIFDVWWTPEPKDWISVPGSAFPVGTLAPNRAESFQRLFNVVRRRYDGWKKYCLDKPDVMSGFMLGLRHSLARLKTHPLTFRELVIFVAEWQRVWLDIYAFVDYVEIILPRLRAPEGIRAVNKAWMGCFTDDSGLVARYRAAGIPVWYVRAPAYIPSNMNIKQAVTITFPDSIVTAQYNEGGKFTQPFPVIYRGPGGEARHTHTRRPYKGMMTYNPNINAPRGDHPIIPLSLFQSSAEEFQHNRDKWVDPNSPLMPPPIQTWEVAMRKVDQTVARLVLPDVDAGYRFPEPALLVATERKRDYFVNWLAARPTWISRVAHDPPQKLPVPQTWRNFLGGGESKKADSQTQRLKEATNHLFGDDILGVVTLATQDGIVPWRDSSLHVSELENPPVRLAQQIIWELYEHSFRFELLALDRAMAPQIWAQSSAKHEDTVLDVFPDHTLVMFSAPFPSVNTGLASTSFSALLPFLEAFRSLLTAWPQFPATLTHPLAPDTDMGRIFLVKNNVVQFYCQCFFNVFGRPPVVPHALPG
ncbi:hypothetical protein BJ138DRAFT_1118719 [Hygrophoropsis aurantiaca]|uniref:Uncharacterized protein n=1 Tax=Hygrophoropsis aurantiaca TaxID=72124 RepID=A0ACB7ZWR7_9AGAM|nr:hypothetical protein BJ138DRAFT_1118719 [Hygrophoropsis aurantiaca]